MNPLHLTINPRTKILLQVKLTSLINLLLNKVKWQKKRFHEKFNNPSLRLSNSFMHLEFQSLVQLFTILLLIHKDLNKKN